MDDRAKHWDRAYADRSAKNASPAARPACLPDEQRRSPGSALAASGAKVLGAVS
jgi:hypothetical protein